MVLTPDRRVAVIPFDPPCRLWRGTRGVRAHGLKVDARKQDEAGRCRGHELAHAIRPARVRAFPVGGPDPGVCQLGRLVWISVCIAVTPENEAEGMTDRICEDAEASLPFAWKAGGSEGYDRALCRVRIVDTDVQMHLLWILRIGPGRRPPVFAALERQLSCAGLCADHDPVL